MKKFLVGAAAALAAVLTAPTGTNAQAESEVMLLHGIPGVDVDVAVDGSVVVPGFAPGDMQDISAFAGETLPNVEVRVAGTEDVAIGPVEALEVPSGGAFTVMAHLDAEGTPTISVFENDTSAVADGTGRVTVRHTAAAPAVDVVAGEDRLIEGAANGDEASLELPAGEISGLQIAPAGGDPIADVPTVELSAGTNLIVYAVGSLEDETFTFFTQERDLEVETSAEQTSEDGSEEGEESGDGTPAPTAVNTGDELAASSSNSMVLFAAAAGLFTLAGGALVLRRRSVDA